MRTWPELQTSVKDEYMFNITLNHDSKRYIFRRLLSIFLTLDPCSLALNQHDNLGLQRHTFPEPVQRIPPTHH